MYHKYKIATTRLQSDDLNEEQYTINTEKQNCTESEQHKTIVLTICCFKNIVILIPKAKNVVLTSGVKNCTPNTGKIESVLWKYLNVSNIMEEPPLGNKIKN
jgi:hypothetical protein